MTYAIARLAEYKAFDRILSAQNNNERMSAINLWKLASQRARLEIAKERNHTPQEMH
jgi:hypothetical protein